MSHKINCSVTFIVLCTFAHTLFSMQEDQALKKALFKNSIPVLAINDYIVNTQSGYHGFKKEISLIADIITRARFTRINNYIALKQKNIIAGRIPAEDDYLEETRNTHCPNFNYIEIEYRKSYKGSHVCNAKISVHTYTYHFVSSRFKSLFTSGKTYLVKDINVTQQPSTTINCPLKWLATRIISAKKRNYKKSYCIELYSDKRVSDWVKVINRNQLFYKSIPIVSVNNFIIPVKSTYQGLQKEAEMIYASLENTKKAAQATVHDINNRIKKHQQAHGAYLHNIPTTKTGNDIMHPSGCSLARRIEITYKESTHNNDAFDIDIVASTFRYRISPSGEFRSKKHAEYTYTIPPVKTKDIVRHLPSNQPSTCYVLTSDDQSDDQHVVDRIIIKNKCNPALLHKENGEEYIVGTYFCERIIFLAGALLGLYFIF